MSDYNRLNRDALDRWITREPPSPYDYDHDTPFAPECEQDCQLPCDCDWPESGCAILNERRGGTGGTDVTDPP